MRQGAKLFFLGLAVALLVSVVAVAQQNSTVADYISSWAPTAVREMYRSGVPASITLAQGILESGAGKSTLAVKGNNHFGIKCHNWKGKSMRMHDDAPNECFRVYDSADESFRDHSDFLRYSDRYKSLFELEITDYKSWANGLKKAGYATDPSYAQKLIKYIEDYKLYEYDKASSAVLEQSSTGSEVSQPQNDTKRRSIFRRKKKSKEKKEDSPSVIPESPLSVEAPRRESAERLSFPLNRELYSINGVPFIYAREGESYSSIAQQYNLFLKEILRYNDLRDPQPLRPGDIVFLQAKKNQAAKGLDKYIVGQDGESLWNISHRFAIKLDKLLKMNSLSADYRLREGDEILLRK